jgi:hypothetical protein
VIGDSFLLTRGCDVADFFATPLQSRHSREGGNPVTLERSASLGFEVATSPVSSPSAGAELLSLCLSKEKVTKEKGHPGAAPDLRPCKSGSRVGCGVFRRHILVPAENSRASMRATLRAFLRRRAAAQGPLLKSRSARFLRARAGRQWVADASLKGSFFVLEIPSDDGMTRRARPFPTQPALFPIPNSRFPRRPRTPSRTPSDIRRALPPLSTQSVTPRPSAGQTKRVVSWKSR